MLYAVHKPDVVMLDVNLSGSNGIEAVRRIRAASPQVWIVVLSGHHDEEFRQASLQAGADYYLDKEDLDIQKLAGMVASLRSLPAAVKPRAEANAK